MGDFPIHNPYIVIVFLAGFFSSLPLVLILTRSMRLFIPVLRIIGRPVLLFGRLARRLPILRKLARRSRKVRVVAAEGGLVIRRGMAGETEIESALRQPDLLQDGTPGTERYDFKEEEKLLHRRGFYFKSIGIPAEYLPENLQGHLSDELASRYTVEAKKFFSDHVSLDANSESLYEDSEGAFVISRFLPSDRRCFYVINEMRKTINDNARRLVLLVVTVFGLWCAAASYGFVRIAGGTAQGTTLEPYSPVLAGPVALWLFCLLFVWMTQNFGYKQQQQHSSRELRFFLTKYLGRVADRYREATGKAKQVTVGDETDAKKIAEAAQKWHKIMIWMPFRTFFIECFVRNSRYQINRNCRYYLWIPWFVGAAVLIACAGYILAHLPGRLPAAPQPLIIWLVAGCFGGMLAILIGVSLNRIYSVVLGEELSQLDWLGYEDLDVSVAMDEVVGKYAEDVGFWKGRFGI